MKRFLSLIIAIILLTSATCSCRSSSQSALEYSDSATVVASESTLIKNEISSLVLASRKLDLSGIKIEFYPPDSLRPDSPPAPKSLSIDNAKANESAGQATQQTAAVDSKKDLDYAASSSMQKDSRCDNDILRPPDWIWIIPVVLVITVILVVAIRRRK